MPSSSWVGTGGASARSADPGPDGTDDRERLVTGALGGVLVVAGLRRRGLGGTLAALGGGLLVSRAVQGRRPGARARDAVRGDRRAGPGSPAGTPEASAAATVRRPASEVSELLRDPETLDRVLGDAVDVTAAGADRQRWTVRANGREATWVTRLEASDERLRWVPVDGAVLLDEWVVDLEPAAGDRGTRVTLRVRFDPPGGRIGDGALARVDALPEPLVATALDRLQSLAETGEVPTLAGNPSARGRGDLL